MLNIVKYCTKKARTFALKVKERVFFRYIFYYNEFWECYAEVEDKNKSTVWKYLLSMLVKNFLIVFRDVFDTLIYFYDQILAFLIGWNTKWFFNEVWYQRKKKWFKFTKKQIFIYLKRTRKFLVFFSLWYIIKHHFLKFTHKVLFVVLRNFIRINKWWFFFKCFIKILFKGIFFLIVNIFFSSKIYSHLFYVTKENIFQNRQIKIILINIIKSTNSYKKQLILLFYNFLFLSIGCFFHFSNLFISLPFITLTLSTFMYFVTIYKFSKLTKEVENTWVRLTNVLWGLEYYLMAILTFFVCIAPEECARFFEKTNWETKICINFNDMLFYKLCLLLLLFLWVKYHSHNRNVFLVTILFVLVVILLLDILLTELNTLFAVLANLDSYERAIIKNSHVKTYNQKYKVGLISISNFNQFETPNLEAWAFHRPTFNILNIVTLIKFSHVFLLIVLNFILILSLNNNLQPQWNSLSLIAYNNVILISFFFFSYIVEFKLLYKSIVYAPYEHFIFSFYNKWILIKEELILNLL